MSSKKNIRANLSFFESFRKEKKKQKQKEQERRNKIIIGSQVQPIASESKYLSWSKFSDL